MFWYLIFLFIFLRLLLHVNHVQPVCTFLSCTVMLILIFMSTVYCHAHSFIFYILFFISYLLFISFYVYFLCVVFYNICTVHGADLTHISLLVIYSLYNRVCDKYILNLNVKFLLTHSKNGRKCVFKKKKIPLNFAFRVFSSS